jgi:hypothetical protein
MHIVRMTADSGSWLPLQSEMDGIKNTKPPLHFLARNCSRFIGQRSWSLESLRWPSALYTALTALLLFISVRRFSGEHRQVFLLHRFGYLFLQPIAMAVHFLQILREAFWLSLPFFALLYWGKSAFECKLLFPVFAGICLGFALFCKMVRST